MNRSTVIACASMLGLAFGIAGVAHASISGDVRKSLIAARALEVSPTSFAAPATESFSAVQLPSESTTLTVPVVTIVGHSSVVKASPKSSAPSFGTLNCAAPVLSALGTMVAYCDVVR